VNSALIPLYRIFPGYSLGDGLLQMASKPSNVSVWSSGITGTNIATLYWTAVVYLLTLIAIEYLISVPKASGFLKRLLRIERDITEDKPISEEDSDVVKEKEGMTSGEISGGSIQVRGLRKVYGSNPQTQKLAVRDLWFNIPKGECFGFLGINGAGK
jgi:ABC-type bacteriocin/lantibiotic exporter with double-glycine peptidase domain